MIGECMTTPKKTVLDARGLKLTRSGGPSTVLANLFRRTIIDLGISLQQWSFLLNRYITDPRNGIPANARDQSVARGNMQKEFFKNTMTWKFFYRAMKVLGAVRFEISITFHHANGTKTVHSEMVEVNDQLNTDDEPEE